MLNLQIIETKKRELNNHPLLVGDVIRTIEDVRIFMQHHVYAVWDFMCLIKTLQHALVPSTTIWVPQPHTSVGRLVNEVILGEETDIGVDGKPVSHYDMYIAAMDEIGADSRPVRQFIEGLQAQGVHMLPQLMMRIPFPAEQFCRTTLEFVATQKPHIVAAAFAFGRETVIPAMFTSIVQQLNERGISTPQFKFYLDRHIQLDGEEHGPASLQMITTLCENDPNKLVEAETTALQAISHRMAFWTAVQAAIEEAR